MKKLILLLLFVPIFSFGQITYKDLMKLDSQDAFEKLMFDKRFSSIGCYENWETGLMGVNGGWLST